MDETIEMQSCLSAEDNEQILQRKRKLQHIRDQGKAYPNDFRRNALAAELHHHYDTLSAEELMTQEITATLAGRLMTKRVMGKASFAHLQDMSGQIQLYIAREQIGEELYTEFKNWDIGDILGVSGTLFKTKTDELSIKVDSIRLLTKALRPFPDKFHGLVDQEQRFRQRYLDLLMNETSRRTFQIRFKLIAELRRFLTDKGFLEVETPMMQSQAGGAAAKPFITHHNALNMELFLRIAPELYLKRLVVAGFEKVFEINRNFRNEGISTRHNPEFTMLEFYAAYSDYTLLMQLTEEMLCFLAVQVLGSALLTYQGITFDLTKPFKRMTLKESILAEQPDIKAIELDNIHDARKLAERFNITTPEAWGLGKIQYELFENLVENNLIYPTFITHFPAEVSPLARANERDPFVTDRFELFIGGRELANGFSELNDPDEQRQRFLQQAQAGEAGDEEAMKYDEDFILALEYGMPPTAGEGIGIDRLAMLFADCDSIREVILFPLLRPKLS